MQVRWRTLQVPKHGHVAAECEDAVAGDPATGRFAIADGASESYAAGEWARLLVDAFLTTGGAGEWLAEPRASWKRDVGARSQSWYAETKFAAGGHATFLGLTLDVVGEGHWSAVAVGDCCLLTLRAGRIASAFPLEHSSAFTAAPAFLKSVASEPLWEAGFGSVEAGETLILATDALAQCLLGEAEADRFDGAELLGLDAMAFGQWVARGRAAGRLRNDDVTLGVIEIDRP